MSKKKKTTLMLTYIQHIISIPWVGYAKTLSN